MFKTPEAAMQAFGDAVTRSDEAALKAMLGDNFRQMIPPVDAEARHASSRRGRSRTRSSARTARARIAVGSDGWSLPIPLARSSSGWSFDTKAGLDEMRIRRIGRNEVAAGADDAGDPRRATRLRERTPRSRWARHVCLAAVEFAGPARRALLAHAGRRAAQSTRTGSGIGRHAQHEPGRLLRLSLQDPHFAGPAMRPAAHATTSWAASCSAASPSSRGPRGIATRAS